jgi:hypothetical protein
MAQYEKIILTFEEIFHRCYNWREFHCLGINPWYLDEGGDPNETKSFEEKAAQFMGIEDFEIRAVSSEYPPDLSDSDFLRNYSRLIMKSYKNAAILESGELNAHVASRCH